MEMEMESKLLSKVKLHSGEETPCLPEQVIVEEILPRLPAKSLLKFRCVSKPWCSLIGSKRFIKAHLKNSIKSSWIANNCFFLDYSDKKFKQCSLPSMFDKLFAHPISHIVGLGIKKFDQIRLAGFCNGLVCIIVNWTRFILWNPTTKKFNNLPDLYNQIQDKREVIEKYGFGFDEMTDDYKVFGIVNRIERGAPTRSIVMIYSLRSNSWKHIEQTDHVSPFNNYEGMDMGIDMGMYVSGKLHWKSYEGEIVSFDLNRHVYGVVELPSYMKGVLHMVRVIEGCLSAHLLQPNGDLDVWLMKEYGAKESWDKVVTFPHYKYRQIPTPVAIAPNGEVLLFRNSKLLIYNPKCDVLRHPQVALDDWFAIDVRSLDIYVESLVSVVPDAQ